MEHSRMSVYKINIGNLITLSYYSYKHFEYLIKTHHFT